MKQITDTLWISGQPTDAELAAARAAGVTRIINNRPEGEEPGQPTVAEAAARAGQLGMEFVHIPVVPGQITRKAVENFQAAVAGADGPVLAHCKSGARSLSLWAIGEVLSGRLDAAGLDELGARHGINLAGAKAWLTDNC
ncbi:TIGR01244 family sulfur transferase [Aminobacter sp. HY435]|uniref:TIGR01244 family sulfur transferase n=1 Tax=Aminobacter sp. HY435 TaxID=2970917 RepID=UPI0022B9D465|nr:TIGR01244 family sulfur transferase [Aminobacter sp. HY435]